MKNLIETLQKEGTAQLQAKKTILHIYQWLEVQDPFLAAVSKSTLIKDILIEINEERRALTSQ